MYGTAYFVHDVDIRGHITNHAEVYTKNDLGVYIFEYEDGYIASRTLVPWSNVAYVTLND